MIFRNTKHGYAEFLVRRMRYKEWPKKSARKFVFGSNFFAVLL